MSLIFSIGVVIICVILLLLTTNRITKTIFDIPSLTQETEYNPKYILIYDKSTKYTLDRFFIIKPFDWLFWAHGRSFYAVHDGFFNCPESSTNAILIPKNKNEPFIDTCISMHITTLIDYYTSITPIKIDYKIDKKKFTKIDIINYLLKNYVSTNY